MTRAMVIHLFEPLALGAKVPVAHRLSYPYHRWLHWHYQNTAADHTTFPGMLATPPAPSLA